ncbi:hypothetical protein LguiA_003251 [Lonicera macranthoides]
MKAKEFQGFVNEFLVITISIQYFEILRFRYFEFGTQIERGRQYFKLVLEDVDEV